ncbi:MAG: cyclic nucleotide-binding domain-containing protein [Mycobacteriales bacterium]
MARRDTTAYFAAIPLFGGCTKKELELLSRNAERATYQPGDVIIKEGSVGYEFFVIVDGKAEVKKGGRVVAALGAGDYVGELALLDRAPRNATVVAATEVNVILLGYREFWGVLSEAPGLDKKLLVGMAKRLRQLEENKLG